MNILNSTYVFYADIYLVQNLLIKFFVIYLSLYCNRLHIYIETLKGIGKIIVISFVATIIEIMALVLGGSYTVFIISCHLLEIPIMMYSILLKERRKIKKLIIAGYFFLMVITSVLEVLWNCFGMTGDFIVLLICASLLTYIGVRIFFRYSRIKKDIYDVELLQDKNRVILCGFYDSGNHLVDPYTGKGVHIISENVKDRLFDSAANKYSISYQSLGNENGFIDIYYVNEMKIYEKEGIKKIKEVPLGVTKDKLFEGRRYEMIINEEVY